MAFENFPAVLQGIFQQNLLDKKFQDDLKALNAYRKSAYRLPIEKRSGETMIYSRAGKLSPVLDDIIPSSNVGLDNGMTGIGGVGAGNPTYPFEQFSVTIGMVPFYLDLNLVQEQAVIADLFKKNVTELAEQAALSLDLRVMKFAFRAYLGGSTWSTAALVGSTVKVDSTIGLDTAFASVTINGNSFSSGLPQAVSPANPLAVTITHASGATETNTIIGVALDGTNVSNQLLNELGTSGTLTFSTPPSSFPIGDTVTSFDAAMLYRPNGKPNMFQLDATDTIGAQLIINSVAELRANGVKPPLENGTYPCYIDPIVDAQFFTDAQYQIMSQGQIESPDFHMARVSRNFGVTFVPTTNAPSFTIQNHAGLPLVVRHAIICGEKYVQESPFQGTAAAIASMPDMGVADYRIVDDIVLVNRMPIDRAGQIMSQGWYWIGGYVAPTDATITKAVIPSASSARYKRAVVVQVASAR